MHLLRACQVSFITALHRFLQVQYRVSCDCLRVRFGWVGGGIIESGSGVWGVWCLVFISDRHVHVVLPHTVLGMGSTQEGKLIPKAGIYQNKGFLVQFRVAVFGFRVWSGLRD